MDILELIKKRRSIRKYNLVKISEESIRELSSLIDVCNKESGMHIQLCVEEPNAFNSLMAHYGKFENVRNYIAFVGEKKENLEEKIGYFGERIVLKATELGLGTCWVASTYNKGKSDAKINKGEKLSIVISLGYSDQNVAPRKSKGKEDISDVNMESPEWYKRGIEAALLAPTAMNQQKFSFSYVGGKIVAKAGRGFYTEMDLGIAKYHFEIAAGKENFEWA